MNITDVPEGTVPDRDLLGVILDQQKSLMAKYEKIERDNNIPNPKLFNLNINDYLDQAKIKDLMWRVVEELGEAGNCLKNKPWKQTQMLTDVDHFHEELSDALHFLLELLIGVGIDTKEKVYQLYFRKAKVNEFRQESQY